MQAPNSTYGSDYQDTHEKDPPHSKKQPMVLVNLARGLHGDFVRISVCLYTYMYAYVHMYMYLHT